MQCHRWNLGQKWAVLGGAEIALSPLECLGERAISPLEFWGVIALSWLEFWGEIALSQFLCQNTWFTLVFHVRAWF